MSKSDIVKKLPGNPVLDDTVLPPEAELPGRKDST